MKRGGKFLVSTTVLAVAACGGQQGKLEIRSTPTPLAEIKRAVPERIAEARGQLALGNVALALTSFRIAAREDPNSIDALAGIADCYDQMGRFDLSRRYYESALALAPADTQLLTAFAASLQLQGKSAEALSVREEISARLAASAALEKCQHGGSRRRCAAGSGRRCRDQARSTEGFAAICRARSKRRSGFAPETEGNSQAASQAGGSCRGRRAAGRANSARSVGYDQASARASHSAGAGARSAGSFA